MCCCRPWGIFLFVITITVLWFSFNTSVKVINYLFLSASVSVDSLEWKIKEVKQHQFAICAKYSFWAEKRYYENETMFEKKFSNQLTAKDFLRKQQSKEWIVWYNPNKAHKSTLEKTFPLKASVYMAILIVILIYFFVLKFFILPKYKCDL